MSESPSSEGVRKVRVFPLPNFVLFPHVAQPLHIFEPRYRKMTEDALADDQILAMAALLPGWQADYEGRPPIAPVVCLGRILTHTKLEDGRFHLLLIGQERAKVIREIDEELPYRVAEVEFLPDHYPARGATTRGGLQMRLVDGLRPFLPQSKELATQLEPLLSAQTPLGNLTDVVASTLPFSAEFKLQLLADANVDRRAEMLISALREAAGDDIRRPPTPPDFSDN